MTNVILILVVCSTVISTIISFAKPSYEGLVRKKYVATISIGLAFILWIVAAFSVDFWLDLTVWAKILMWLALWTGSTIWYDAWEILKAVETKLSWREEK